MLNQYLSIHQWHFFFLLAASSICLSCDVDPSAEYEPDAFEQAHEGALSEELEIATETPEAAAVWYPGMSAREIKDSIVCSTQTDIDGEAAEPTGGVEEPDRFDPTQRLPPSFTPPQGSPPHAYDAVGSAPLDATDAPPLPHPRADQRLAELREATQRGDDKEVRALLQEATP